jgi:hypothetical protein
MIFSGVPFDHSSHTCMKNHIASSCIYILITCI